MKEVPQHTWIGHHSNQSVRDLTLGFLLKEPDKRNPSVVFLLLVLFPEWATLALPGETLRHLSAETETAATPPELVP